MTGEYRSCATRASEISFGPHVAGMGLSPSRSSSSSSAFTSTGAVKSSSSNWGVIVSVLSTCDRVSRLYTLAVLFCASISRSRVFNVFGACGFCGTDGVAGGAMLKYMTE